MPKEIEPKLIIPSTSKTLLKKLDGFTLKFCFVCGRKLEKCEPGWFQCKSQYCGEIYFPFVDKNDNECVMRQQTPFSVKLPTQIK